MTDRLATRLVDAIAPRMAAGELQRLVELANGPGQSLVSLLVRSGMVAEDEIVRALAQRGFEIAPASEFPAVAESEPAVPPAYFRAVAALPLRQTADAVDVAMADPTNEPIRHALALAYGKRIVPRLAALAQIEQALARLYPDGPDVAAAQSPGAEGVGSEPGADEERLRELAADAPTVRRVQALIDRALELRASDLHLEPAPDRLTVRYRIDGVLHDAETVALADAPAVCSRIKILARLNIAERRLPQDGRIRLRLQGRYVDFRVSCIPGLHGESLVLRVLDRERLPLDLEQLGFNGELRASLLQELARPHGIAVVTGPTGSGKTTTLYAALALLNARTRKVVTVEDPVEYQLPGIVQIPARADIGLTFPAALRSILRHDPDVIMIGEMRDAETAAIAVQSALTGHLVLSTLHTNDAAGAVTRLLDMGVEDYLVTSTVNAVLAQRLVRLVCRACAPETTPGCPACGGSGYRGRTAIGELLRFDDAVRALIRAHADTGALRTAAMAAGMRPLYQDGMRCVADGLTTAAEVMRVTQDL